MGDEDGGRRTAAAEENVGGERRRRKTDVGAGLGQISWRMMKSGDRRLRGIGRLHGRSGGVCPEFRVTVSNGALVLRNPNVTQLRGVRRSKGRGWGAGSGSKAGSGSYLHSRVRTLQSHTCCFDLGTMFGQRVMTSSLAGTGTRIRFCSGSWTRMTGTTEAGLLAL